MTHSPDSITTSLQRLAGALQQTANQLGLPRLGAQIVDETARRTGYLGEG